MLRRTALALSAAGLALLAAPALADHHEEGEMKAPDLSGVYKLTGGEKYGEAIPAARLKDNSSTIVGEDGKGRWAVVDKDKADLYASDFKIVGPAKIKGEDGEMMKDVYEIDLLSQIPEAGSKAPGLVKVTKTEKNGKMVVTKIHLIYALDGNRPTDLKTNGKQLAFMMERTAAPATEDGTPADEDEEQG